jgi:hypothetical protein
MDRKWRVSQGVLSSKIDNEIVLMSIESGYYYTLDQTGSIVWDLLSKQQSTIEELTVQLMEEFEVDKETCMKDVQEFIDDMASKKLIIPVDEQEQSEK